MLTFTVEPRRPAAHKARRTRATPAVSDTLAASVVPILVIGVLVLVELLS